MNAVLTLGVFGFVSYVAWRTRSSFMAYVSAAVLGIGSVFYAIGNGFTGQAPYALGLAVALGVVGFLRDRIQT